MVKVSREISPDPQMKDFYDGQFDRYLRTYPALKDLMHETVAEQKVD
jgi:hypothetical protein